MDVAGSVIKTSMIIKELHIDGFGVFNKYSLTHLKEGINIVVGKNEAGKSTMLKFIRYTLFGYPRSKGQRMQPIFGGSHGGRIKAVVSSNKELTFERNGNDQITLYYEGKSSHNQSQWYQFLGNATKEVFDNIYAFSLDELVDIKSLSTSGVEDKIFSIGMGLGNVSISELEDHIKNKVDANYTPRGSKQQIPIILSVIQDIKSRLFEIQNNIPIYRDLSERIKQLEIEIAAIEKRLKGHTAIKEQLDDYLKCYESFVTIVKIDKMLETLPEIRDYPVDGIERLNELGSEEKALVEKTEDLQHGSESGEGIEELQQEIDAISLNHKLLNSQDKIEYLRVNHELYKKTVREKTEIDGKIEEIDQLIKGELLHINPDWSEDSIVNYSRVIIHKDRIREFRTEFEAMNDIKRDLEAEKKALQRRESAVNANNLVTLVSLIILLGSAPAFYYALYVLGIACVVVALLLFAGRKFIIKESFKDKISRQLMDLNHQIDAIKHRYEEYVEKNLKLDKTLSIAAVTEILDKIGHLKNTIEERNELIRKQKEQRIPFINKFVDTARSVQEISAINLTDEPIEIHVNQILQEYDEAKELLQRKEALHNALSTLQKELIRTQDKIGKNELKLSQLLKSVHAKSKDDFRKKYEENNEVKALTEKRKHAAITIETIAGLHKSDEVIGYLSTREQHDIKEESERYESETYTMRNTLNDRNKELGEKKGEIKRIEGESDLAAVMTELESERQKLGNAYREWMTGKIALKILNEVKETYEREQQPEVVKNSGVYFSKITDGKYNRIKVAFDEKDITVFDAREVSKKIAQLSRGTREQLLIGIRLGFIEEYETKTEPLPVIIDEVLVNFDPDRAKKAAAVLQEFGKERQILIFTCHPSILEYFSRNEVNPVMLD